MHSQMHIVMILYASFPLDTRVRREAAVLAQAGYRVSVIDTDWGLAEKSDVSEVGRHSVMRIRLSQRASLLGLLRFWIAVFLFLYKDRHQIDVIHAHDLTGLPPAFLLKLLRPSIVVVYDSHELFPEAALEKLSAGPYAVFLGIELICSRLVDFLISVSPSNLKALSARIHVPSFLVMNTPDVSDIRSRMGRIPSWAPRNNRSQIRVAYSGQIHSHRGYMHLIDAAEALSNDGRFQFWVIGGGPGLSQLKEEVVSRRLLSLFVFTGRVGYEDLLSQTADCDMAVALYESTWNNNSSIANKLFEYMMVGIPFIYTDLTQSIPIVRMAGARILANPIDGEALAKAIVEMASDRSLQIVISQQSKLMVEQRFNWNQDALRLRELYSRIESARA